MDRLTPRQYQVVTLVARGLSNKEVARQLGISEGTAKLHVHNIFRKLAVNSRYAVIAMMDDAPVLQEPPPARLINLFRGPQLRKLSVVSDDLQMGYIQRTTA